MMLGDEIAAVLPELRAHAESMLTDTCRITIPGTGSPGAFNPETGQYDDPTPDTVVYEGVCRIPPRGTATTTRVNAAEQSFDVGEYPFEVPVDGDGYVSGDDVAPGQRVEFLTSAHNPRMVGKVFGVVDPVYKSHPTRLQFKIKTNVGG